MLTNAAAVKAAKTPAGKSRVTIPVSGVQGLVLHVSATGNGVYYFHYSQGGRQARKQPKIRLGKRDVLSLAEARAKAAELYARVEKGEDPAQDRQPKTAVQMTFRDVWSRRTQSDQRLAASTAVKQGALLERHAGSLLKMPVLAVKSTDVMAARNKLRDRGVLKQADDLKTIISATFRWAAGEQLVPAGHNPAHGIPNVRHASPKDRVLSEEELARLLAVLHASNSPTADILMLCLLTGARRGEVAAARRASVTSDEWTLSGDTTVKGKRIRGETKNGKEWCVPLSRQAASRFHRAMARHAEPYVFPAHTKTVKIGRTPKFPHINPDAVNKSLERFRCDAGIQVPFGVHDLRRTFATWLGGKSAPREVRRLLVNHVVASSDILDSTYNHAAMLPERREWLQRWADYLDGLTTELVQS